jgi:hypothetical protein
VSLKVELLLSILLELSVLEVREPGAKYEGESDFADMEEEED